MDKEKEIEEMAQVLCQATKICKICNCSYKTYAERLYNAGYRKAIPNIAECLGSFIDEAKQEAIKEFAEKIKDKMYDKERMGVHYKQALFSDYEIDDLLKEYGIDTQGEIMSKETNTKVNGGYDFANDSWATIASQIKAGTDHYNLGDTKTDTITIDGTSYTATFKIVDNLVGRYATQSGQSHKVIEIQELFGLSNGNGVAWNSSGRGTSFANSSLNTNLNNTLINFLPSELRAVLETTTVYSGDGTHTASASTNVSATGKLFVASFNEYYGADVSYGYANNTETNGKGQYAWYQQAGVTTSNYDDMIKYKVEDGSSAWYYWTRSPSGSFHGNGTAVRVTVSGSYTDDDVISDLDRVAPCFAW